MQCPKCGGEMETVFNDNLCVDRCDNCHGLYFDHLTQMDVERVAANAHIDTGVIDNSADFNDLVYVECPRCFGIMDQRTTDDPVSIKFETCTACHSAFLDAGELTFYLSDPVRPHFESLLPEED